MEYSNPNTLVVENLRHYFAHISTCLGKNNINMPGALITFSEDLNDPSFNFVFTDYAIQDHQNLENVYNHLKYELKTKATWVIEPRLKNVSDWLLNMDIIHISKPKKMLLKIENYIFPAMKEIGKEYELVVIKTEEELRKYDEVCAKCFHHNTQMAFDLFKAFFRQKDLKLKILLLNCLHEVVGGCVMYTHNDTVGFYADAVMRPYRNAGLGSFMISERIKLALSEGCRYAIAQCFPMSVALYERFGFKNIGGLLLQSDFR